jgi:cell division protein FtsI/penicillin-binding protein 2
MTKVGLKLGSDRLYTYLRQFGFGQNTGLGLAGESGGILRNVNSWAKIDTATHSFGQGIAVTPLQVVRAVAAISNGGTLPKLSVVSLGAPPEGERVLSEKAAKTAKEMM